MTVSPALLRCAGEGEAVCRIGMRLWLVQNARPARHRRQKCQSWFYLRRFSTSCDSVGFYFELLTRSPLVANEEDVMSAFAGFGLVPLSRIPAEARDIEVAGRRKWKAPDMALDAARIKITCVTRDGESSHARMFGWVLTAEAADALVQAPGMAGCERLDYEVCDASSEALGDYVEAIARGVPRSEALLAYIAARTC